MLMPRIIANAIHQVARNAVGKDWMLYSALLDHWQEIVGIDYAELTTPVKITFPYQPNEQRRCNGSLSIRLPKGLAMEFSFKSEQIKQRINNYFGYEAVTRITFDTTHIPVPPSPPPPQPISMEDRQNIQTIVKDFPDDELRKVLESFGEILLSSKLYR